jgi:glycine/D-amino acid oxidase-like deaminating enzyme
MPEKHVIVVGAGIIGASIAYHLVQAGARVTIIAEKTGGTATPASFAWINASWGNDPAYFRLRFDSLQRWRKLELELPDLGLSWGGSLTYDISEPELQRYVTEFGARGYPLRLIDSAEARILEPNLLSPPHLAAFAEAEGSVEPRTAALAFIKASSAQLLPTSVHGLDVVNGRLMSVMTDDGPVEADHFVIAAGANSTLLLKTVGVILKIDNPPGLILHSAPTRRLLHRIIIAPKIHVRQTTTGEIIAGSDFGGSPIERGPMAVSAELMDQIRATVRGTDEITMERYSIGYRPMPQDERPIIGLVPGIEGLYVAVMHSGITNAPAIGAYATDEILHDRRHDLIASYGIERFL